MPARTPLFWPHRLISTADRGLLRLGAPSLAPRLLDLASPHPHPRPSPETLKGGEGLVRGSALITGFRGPHHSPHLIPPVWGWLGTRRPPVPAAGGAGVAGLEAVGRPGVVRPRRLGLSCSAPPHRRIPGEHRTMASCLLPSAPRWPLSFPAL